MCVDTLIITMHMLASFGPEVAPNDRGFVAVMTCVYFKNTP